MVDSQTHIERAMASITNQEVDRLSTYPIACGVNRKLINNGAGITYRDWAHDAKLFADAAVAGYKHFDWDWYFGLMDLSVMAGDLGAEVKFDEQNTPYVSKPAIKDPEDYEKLEVPDVKRGRSRVIIEGTKQFSSRLKNDIITSGFIEGPLLALTQTAGAEKVFMDMYNNRSAVHKALETITAFDKDLIHEFAQTDAPGLCWDYLWGSYSCLGDDEYNEFEGQHKYAGCLNELTQKEGKAFCIHNCADLPHLDTQIKKFKPAIYSLAYYPLVPGSLTAKQTIEKGYADNTLLAGNIDPQAFVRATPEAIERTTLNLIKEVNTALDKRGLKGRYVIASGCEVPPAVSTKLENIKKVVDTVKTHGHEASA